MSIRLKDTIYDLINKANKDGSGNTITDTYLKLSGGIMTFTSINDFILKKTGNLLPLIAFQGPTSSEDSTNIKYGYLGFNGADNPVFGKLNSDRSSVSAYYSLIHSGNYTSYVSAKDHTHKYAGSDSVGGAATSALTSTKLTTARTLWGQSFNGTANVSGNMTGVGSISMSGALTLTGTDSSTALISFSRQNYNYITFPTGYSLAFGVATGSANTLYRMTDTAFFPERTNEVTLGTSSLKWKNVYATTFTGALSGNATSAGYSTHIRITSTNPTSATTYNPIWAVNSSATSDGTSDYTPRANNGFSYITLEGTESALGYGIVRLGNSTASGTAGNKYGMLRLYSESSGYVNIRPGSASTSNYTLFLPGAAGQLVYHTNDTQVGAAAQPVYVTSGGEIAACSISAGSGNSNRCLMVTNGSNGMYYTPTITGNYVTGDLISTVSDATYVKHTCTNSNGSVSLYAATNRGLYDNTNGAWIIYLTTAADHVYVSKWASKGSTTAPVYFNSSGEPTQGSTYAGGTKVTLNGTAKGASTASFYAPTGAGTSGQYLISSGGAPTWTTINPYDANISRTANTVLAAPNGSAGNATFRKLVAADLPTMYWANVAISSSSSTTKAPTFASVSLGKTDTYGAIYMLRDAGNYIKCGSTSGSDGKLAIIPGGQDIALAAADLIVATNEVYPGTTNVTSLGTSSLKWSNVYATTFTGKMSTSFTVFGQAYNGSAAKTVTGETLVGTLSEGTSNLTDGTMLLTSYASDNGFADTNAPDKIYKRKASCVWGYIKGKTDAAYAAKSHTHSGYAASSHTHSYAGSSSAGGAATSANKLNTDAGGSFRPVYFSGGIPIAGCRFEVLQVRCQSSTNYACSHYMGESCVTISKVTYHSKGRIQVSTDTTYTTAMIWGVAQRMESTVGATGFITVDTTYSNWEVMFSDDASTNWGTGWIYVIKFY